MSTLSATARSQRGTLGDLAAMWMVFSGVLAFLDVPLRNAPLFAVALVLQATLGTVSIVRLLRGMAPSLLLMMGPGLMLGGAISIVIFQISGRGLIGTITTMSIGVIALVALVYSSEWSILGPRWWTFGQLVGISMTAVITEFAELLPIAMLFLIIGFASDPTRPKSRWLLGISMSVAFVVAGLAFTGRERYWWLVTDDYQFFEVVSRHITRSGLFADWGVANFARYHWLAYGWSGLLDTLGGSPPPFVTITRVMPIVFSLSLAASLVLLTRQLTQRAFSMGLIIPSWTVVALADLDWSGTSTAGVYAVIAALVCLLYIVIDRQVLSIPVATLIGVFALLLALTKLPSIFVAQLLLISIAVTRTCGRSRGTRYQILPMSIGLVASLGALFPSIWLLSQLLSLPFEFVAINPALGQITWFGRDFLIPALVLNRLWLWFLVTWIGLQIARDRVSNRRMELFFFPVVVSALIAGLILEVTLTSNMDNHKYFSHTMYFMASLSLLAVPNLEGSAHSSMRDHTPNWTIAIVATAAGLTWDKLNLRGLFWDFVGSSVVQSPTLAVELLRFVTNDSRFAVTVVAAVTVIVMRSRFSTRNAVYTLLLPLVIVTLNNYVDQSRRDFSKAVSASEIEENLGREAERKVGQYLRKSTGDSELVATNHLVARGGGFLSDYSLAVWSEREFLILGPRFFKGETKRRDLAILQSTSFADNPNYENCQAMRELGVSWFVVDLQLTNQRHWSTCATQTFAVENFVVLSLS